MSEPPAPRPPRTAELLVRLCVGTHDKGRAIRGDLYEEFVEVVEARGAAAGARWYWRESVELCVLAPFSGRGTLGDWRGRIRTGDGMMMGFATDLRAALRAQRRQMASTGMAVLALGLGIGSSTAVVSALKTVLVPEYSFPEPERLVLIGELDEGGVGRLTVPHVQTMEDGVPSLVGVAGFRSGNLNLTGLEVPQRLDGLYTTADFFDVLGLRPVDGVGFDAPSGTLAARDRVVLTHDLWSRLGGSREILQSTLTLDGESYAVAGVLPADFWFPTSVDVVLSAGADASFTDPSDTRRVYHALGRLVRGASPAAARADLDRALGAVHGSAAPELAVRDLQESVVGGSGRVLVLLQAAAGLLLVLGLANAAGIIVARSVDRRREAQLRLALGARSGRLTRAALAEGLILGAAGGVVGFAIAAALVEVLPALTPIELSGPGSLGLDPWALSFCAGAALITGALVSVLPAALAVRTAGRLQLGERAGGTGARVDRHVQHGLLTVQVALSLVLAAGAESVTRDLLDTMASDPGFRGEGVLTMRISLSGERYRDSRAIASFYHRLSDEVGSLPAVETAGVTLALPFSGTNIEMPMYFSGGAGAALAVTANFRAVAAEYFQTLEIPLTEGRHTFRTGTGPSAGEAMVSEAVARALGRSPVGMTVRLDPDDERGFRIVGVVGDVRHSGLVLPPEPEVYLSYEAYPMSWGYLVTRTAGDPLALVPVIQRTVAELDPTQPVHSITSLDGLLSESLSRERLVVVLSVLFAACALLIMGAGLYGVVAQHVARGTRELAVRGALGADAWTLVRRTVRGVGIAVAAGAILGTLATRLSHGLVAGWIQEVPDPGAFSFLVAGAAILLTSLAGAWGPTRRATRIDLTQALADD